MDSLFAPLSIRRALLALIALWLLTANAQHSVTAAEPSNTNQLAAARQQLYAAYSAQLHALVEQCDAQQLAKQAAFMRAWLPERDPTMIYVFALPASSAAPATLVQSAAEQAWWTQFTQLRTAQAEKLFALAQAALADKQDSLAFELVRETVRENPGHEAARRVLGDRKLGQAWVSPEAARRLETGQVWSEQFGWLPAERLKRYQSGERYYRGEWISAAEDVRLHSNIRNGWNVESDHYTVVTNNSLETGAQLAAHLEMLYQVWRQAFVGYYATPVQMEQWFAAAQVKPAAPSDVDRSPPPVAAKASSGAIASNGGEYSLAPSASSIGPHKPHQVVYFHDRQQYIDALKPAQPQIEMSVGFYSDAAHTAYFFASDDPYPGTLYHEATHQLFRELPPASVDPGRKNNFWVVEAIACYMESFAQHQLLEGEAYGSYITLGGENAGRVPAARKRLLDDNFYVPLRELSTYGMVELQHDSRLPAIYSQIAGQAFFLMQADAARYRPALMNYLIAVYTGHSTLDSLEKFTGQKFEQLDQQYREFMK
jgi:hypothetical protein